MEKPFHPWFFKLCAARPSLDLTSSFKQQREVLFSTVWGWGSSGRGCVERNRPKPPWSKPFDYFSSFNNRILKNTIANQFYNRWWNSSKRCKIYRFTKAHKPQVPEKPVNHTKLTGMQNQEHSRHETVFPLRIRPDRPLDWNVSQPTTEWRRKNPKCSRDRDYLLQLLKDH